MAEQRSDIWIWALVIAATSSVVALAVMQGHRPESRLTGKPAPQVALPLLGGGKSAIQHGKVTMVDFWATWCAPCRASMPRIQKVWQEYARAGVDLFSVDTDDPSPDRDAQVSEFLMQNRLTFPVVLDDGSAEQAFSVVSLPTMVLLDKEGKIVWSHVGALNASREGDLRAALNHALAR
ncbi:MAG: TlpA family protein disulfide reductase [Myxococcales bacterium]|nr:TlpA family protein disulfide reductase [Myxococcales bacterium]